VTFSSIEQSRMEKSRYFLKDTVRHTIDLSQSDQNRGLEPPPLEKPIPADAKLIKLVRPGKWKNITGVSLENAIANRQSRRIFLDEPITLDELSFLLWATQGIRRLLDHRAAFHTVPSAGARHALETYLGVMDVSGLEKGIYRYLPLEHQLLFEFSEKQMAEKLVKATLGQTFVGQAPLVFIWTAVPYRMEWRYDVAAHKLIAIDAGHVCQNLYLACEAINAGCCAVAAYNQESIDQLLHLDGKDEFVIYLAPVGKV
jgi:SagB-type dehydrogenase family enzyme